MTALEIRPAGPADVDAVVTLIESAYRGEVSRAGWTTEADLLAGRRTGSDEVGPVVERFLLALAEGALLGCCKLDPLDGGALFGSFAVLPIRQGAGVGRALMAAAEDKVRTGGGTFLEMTVIRQRPELIAYYVRHGYLPTGETKPFPYGDERFGIPLRDDLVFDVLRKTLQP